MGLFVASYVFYKQRDKMIIVMQMIEDRMNKMDKKPKPKEPTGFMKDNFKLGDADEPIWNI